MRENVVVVSYCSFLCEIVSLIRNEMKKFDEFISDSKNSVQFIAESQQKYNKVQSFNHEQYVERFD